MSRKLHIKNMVCDRCIMTVKGILQEMDIKFSSVDLGEVEVNDVPPPEKLSELDKRLKQVGFELIMDEKTRLTEQIKSEIINLIYKHPDLLGTVNLSDYLQEKLSRDYSSLSNIFSQHQGITIERYFILQKIERAKELLSYGEMNITEIAYSLGYSSSQYLSAQFKKITGMTPSQYQKSLGKPRRPLDKVE